MSITDGDGGSAFTSGTVTVSNVAPTLTETVVPSPVTEGTSTTISATATDPGDDPLTFVFDFGDGSPRS